jgi:hypothetical protein
VEVESEWALLLFVCAFLITCGHAFAPAWICALQGRLPNQSSKINSTLLYMLRMGTLSLQLGCKIIIGDE